MKWFRTIQEVWRPTPPLGPADLRQQALEALTVDHPELEVLRDPAVAASLAGVLFVSKAMEQEAKQPADTADERVDT